jgi:hypothetical protein
MFAPLLNHLIVEARKKKKARLSAASQAGGDA